MTAYLLTPLAQQELEDVWLYIARDSFRNADRVEGAIYRTCEKLALQPLMGHPIPRCGVPGVLFFTVTEFPKYMVAYYPDKKPLQIVGVLHGARDLSARFR